MAKKTSSGSVGSATVKRLEASSFTGRDGDLVTGYRIHGFGKNEWFGRKEAAIAVWLSTQPELLEVLKEYCAPAPAPVKVAKVAAVPAAVPDAGMAAQLAALQAMVLQLAAKAPIPAK